MTGMIGADVEALVSLADSFSAAATRLNAVNDGLTSQLKVLPWVGEHADATRSRWFASSTAVLRDSAELLHSSARELRRNAQQQIDASSAADGSSSDRIPSSHRAPAPEDSPWPLYLGNWGKALYKNGVAAEDIRQGFLGDCFFLATLAALAATPAGREFLSNMVEKNADGTYRVTFADGTFEDVTGALPAYVTGYDEDGKPIYAPMFARATDDKWVALVEKAVAQRLGHGDLEAGYASLGVGGPLDGSRGFELLGIDSHYEQLHRGRDPFDLTPVDESGLEDIITSDADGDGRRDNAVTLWRDLNREQPGKPSSYHEFAVTQAYERNGEVWVAVRNPWGTNIDGNKHPLEWPPGVVVGTDELDGYTFMSVETMHEIFGGVKWAPVAQLD